MTSRIREAAEAKEAARAYADEAEAEEVRGFVRVRANALERQLRDEEERGRSEREEALRRAALEEQAAARREAGLREELRQAQVRSG